MVFHDDMTSEEVVKQTVDVVREAARMIGKADRGIHNADIQALQVAIEQLSNVLDLKGRMNADRT